MEEDYSGPGMLTARVCIFLNGQLIFDVLRIPRLCVFGPLRVDHAMAFVNRSFVARVLTEYNVLQLFGLVRGILISGRILFLSEFFVIMPHVSTLPFCG